MTAVISVSGGNLSRGGRPILRGIAFSARQGEVVAVLGGNGSGKSTLVRGVMGLSGWSSGQVSLFGTPLGQFKDWHRVGYVPQRVTVGAGVPATVQEVVASGRLSRRRLLMPMRRVDRQAVDQALAVVELTDRRNDAVSQLSGGQQQRVLIGRALAGEPDLLVMDEPNAGIDQHNQVALAETLRALNRTGSTMVLVLHELGPLAGLIDRAVVLRDGRVVYDGPPAENDRVAGPGVDHGHHHHDQHDQPRAFHSRGDNIPMRSGWDL